MAKNSMIFKSNADDKKKEKKTDRRTLYTRKVIMDSYIQLLKEKPREKIKITELCQLAEINRCTFYLHFVDIHDVEDSIEKELFEKFRNYVQTQKSAHKNRQALSDSFLEKMLHDDTYVTLLSVQQSKSPLIDLMKDYYQNELNTSLPPDNHLSDRQKELLYDFVVGGVNAVQMNWIHSGTRHIKEENLLLDKMVQKVMSIKDADSQ